MHTLARIAILLLAAGLSLPPGSLAQGVDIQPTSVEIPAEAGARHRQVLEVSNPSATDPLSLTLGLADWTLARDGRLKLSPPGEGDRSAAGWARFTPGFVALEPGASARVIVDMIVPAKPASAGDYRFALMASQVTPDETGRMQKVETASLFYLTLAPAVSEPVIEDVIVRREVGSTDRLEVTLSNSGNAHARLEGEIRIEAGGQTVETVPVANLVILGASERRFTVPLQATLPQGARVDVRLDNIFAPGSQTGEAALRTFSAPLDAVAG